LENKKSQILLVPLHNEIDKGTLKFIYKQVVQFIPSVELNPFFI